MTFNTDCRGQGVAAQDTALFSVAKIEVTVACPQCSELQPSPRRWSSETWDRDEVTEVGPAGVVTCEGCGVKFRLPQKLFNVIAGV